MCNAKKVLGLDARAFRDGFGRDPFRQSFLRSVRRGLREERKARNVPRRSFPAPPPRHLRSDARCGPTQKKKRWRESFEGGWAAAHPRKHLIDGIAWNRTEKGEKEVSFRRSKSRILDGKGRDGVDFPENVAVRFRLVAETDEEQMGAGGSTQGRFCGPGHRNPNLFAYRR